MNVRFAVPFLLLFIFSSVNAYADESAEAETSQPPSFGMAIDLMVAERQKLSSYHLEFVTVIEKTYDNDASSSSLIEGMLALDASKGISVCVQRNLETNYEGTESEYMNAAVASQSRDVVAIDTPALQATGSNTSDILAFTRFKRPAFRKPFLAFDIRAGAFGFAGDFTSGRTLEGTVIGLAETFAARSGKWVAPGVAEYLLPGHIIQIDLDRGCWPIAFKQIGYEIVEGKHVQIEAGSGQLSLIKRDEIYVPERLTLESKSLRIEYLFEFLRIGSGYPLEEWDVQSITTEFGNGRTPKEVPFGVHLKQALIR